MPRVEPNRRLLAPGEGDREKVGLEVHRDLVGMRVDIRDQPDRLRGEIRPISCPAPAGAELIAAHIVAQRFKLAAFTAPGRLSMRSNQ